MFSAERLQKIREKKGLTKADMARELGMARSSYLAWESGKTQPNQKNRQALADLLGVEPTYFESEYEIVNTYLQLSRHNQRVVLALAKRRLAQEKAEAAENILQFPIQVREEIVLAAGSGFGFSDESATETVYAPESQPNHDVAVWISGDSMLPDYVSGEIALIKQTGFDYDGAVYAVVINGQTVIKKVYREDDGIRLVSINTDYADRFVSYEEDITIVGKVIGHFMPLDS